MAVLNRRERWRRRKGKPPKPLPMPKDRGLTFEELSVDHLDLDTRIRNVLKKYRLWTVESLLRETPKELLDIYGLGRKGVEQIEWQLRTIGLALRPSDPKDRSLS